MMTPTSPGMPNRSAMSGPASSTTAAMKKVHSAECGGNSTAIGTARSLTGWADGIAVCQPACVSRSASAGLGELPDHAELMRDAGRLGPVRDAELPVDAVQVELHGLVGEEELVLDRAIGQAARHGAQHLELAAGQPGPDAHVGLDVLAGELLNGCPIDRRGVEEDVAGERVAQEGRNVERVDRLRDVRRRASREDALDGPRVVIAREDGDGHGGMAL